MIPASNLPALSLAAADLARAADPTPPPSVAVKSRKALPIASVAGAPAGLSPAKRKASLSAAKGSSARAGYAAASATTTSKNAASGASAKKPSAAASGSSSSTTAAKDPLAFLHDPKLSIEEKLMRLLEHLNSKWEKDMQKKLDEIAGHSSTSGSGSTSSSKSPSSSSGSSILGKIVDGAKKLFPQVGIALDALKNPAVRSVLSKIGGPVLAAGATALGYPALAPALLKYAPVVIDLAAGAAASLDSGGSSGASSSAKSGGTAASGSGSSASGGTGLSDNEMKLKLMEVQRIQDAQKEMFALVSNILRSSHEMKMSVIGNLR